MKIDGLGQSANLIKAKKVEPQENLQITEENTNQEPIQTEPQQELKGVLKLLAQGHFKGVADLRLRINHAEKLEGVELPEISPPNGNGKAYEKFLEIYNQMNAPQEPTPPEATVPEQEQPIGEPADQSQPPAQEFPTTEEPVEEPIEIDLNIEPLIPEQDTNDKLVDQILDPEPVIPMDYLA